MKRSMRVAWMVVGVLALASTASAGDSKSQGSKNWNGVKQSMLRKLGVSGENYNFSKKSGKKQQQQQQPPQEQQPQYSTKPWNIQGDVFGQPNGNPPARPGYVFVDGHWQRERAPQNTAPQTVTPVQPQLKPGYVFVDGHWQRERAPQQSVTSGSQTSGGSWNVQGVEVRDHRTSDTSGTQSRYPNNRGKYGYGYPQKPSGPGGTVTVTDPNQKPREPRPIEGVGPGLHNLFGLIPDMPELRGDFPREHREGRPTNTTWKPNGGGTSFQPMQSPKLSPVQSSGSYVFSGGKWQPAASGSTSAGSSTGGWGGSGAVVRDHRSNPYYDVYPEKGP